MFPSLPSFPGRLAASAAAGFALALSFAWAPAEAQGIDPASINRVDAPPCTPSISAPGQVASLLCESNGNAVNRSGGSSLNAAGVMRGAALAQVDFEAISRDAQTLAVWRDGLVWLGGATPAQLALDIALNGTFSLAITRRDNTVSPLGTEQGRLGAALQLGVGGAGTPAAFSQRELTAGLQRDSSTLTGNLLQPVALAGQLNVPLSGWAAGTVLPLELRLSTTALADNDWFRSGAGTVVGQADFLAGSGLAGLRWLDAAGQDISDQVQWQWQVGVSPVPEPAAFVLLGLGLAALAWRVRRRGARASRRAAVGSAALALAASLLPASASAQLTTTAEVHDLYTPAGPIVDRDFRTQNYVGSITAERWRAGSSDFRQGGLAHARYTWTSGFDGTLVAGTSALARSDAGYNGYAQSSLGADFGIAVQMYGPNDGFSQLLWTQMMVQAGCSGDSGCVFNLSFLHQTTGRIAYANSSGDREASFSETVTLRSTSFGQTFEQRAAGEVGVRLRNNQTVAETRFSGDWSASNLQAFGPTPASQLGLFPAGDTRNALDDPQGDLQGWNFRHTEVLTIPVHFWPSSTFGALGELQLFGEVAVSLDQLARAGIGPFVYSSSTLSVDFADTSRFSFSSITDPAGVVDFSQTRVALVASPVPEPDAAWLALGGLGMLWARLRSRRRDGIDSAKIPRALALAYTSASCRRFACWVRYSWTGSPCQTI